MMLKGKTALITGASRGIGKVIAETFVKNGARVIINARKDSALDEFVNELTNQYRGEVLPVYFDVSDPKEVKNGFKELFNFSKTLDVLVNNAGIIEDGLFNMVKPETVENIFSTNTFGAIYCSQYASRLMIKKQIGSIINIGSIVGDRGMEGLSIYSGSKAALIGLTKSLSKEFAKENIRVNLIAPGFIDTDMNRKLSQEKYNHWLSSVKMNRIGTPQDVANAALFLASDLSEYITGQVIVVDGGLVI